MNNLAQILQIIQFVTEAEPAVIALIKGVVDIAHEVHQAKAADNPKAIAVTK